MRISGDLRVRNESLFRSGSFSPAGDVNHARIRVRVALEARHDDHWGVGLRFATGGGTTSTNQDLDALAGPAGMYVDRAYAEYRTGESALFRFTAGRAPNPYLHSPMLWDSDYNPDGLVEAFDFARDGSGVFLNLGQHVLGQEASKDYGPSFFAFQPGLAWKRERKEVEAAVAYYRFAEAGGTDDVPAGGDYAIADLYLRFRKELTSGMPLSLWLDALTNTEATGDASAYGLGVEIGSSKGKGKAKASFAYMSIDADALWIDLGDASFSRGLSDADMHGFVLGFTVGLGEKATLGATWRSKDARDLDAHEDRLDLDLVVRF